jgi:hypothetical protein
MSGGICEPRHENGSTEHHAAVHHLSLCYLGDVATTTHGILQHAFGDDAMSTHKSFAGTICFLKALSAYVTLCHSRRK